MILIFLSHFHLPSPFLLLLIALVPYSLFSTSVSLGVQAKQDASADGRPKRDFTQHKLSDDEIERVVQADPPQWESVTDGHLGKLLIPRASGSDNNTLVQKHISSVFTKLGWHEEKTPFRGSTPIGEVEFTNLVYTFDPEAERKIVLSAHFDSKWFPDFPANQFIGATDSAAPCALLLSLAEFVTPLLSSRADRISAAQGVLKDGFDEEEAARTTLQIVFFDGEEAFHDWTDTDSIYGARHLAETWSETYLPTSHPLSRRRLSPSPTVLNTIDVLVLLDLLGNKHSSLHSYFRETDWLFSELGDADKRLRELDMVEVENGEEGWFSPVKMRRGMIGDDHVPFLHRGVSVLHVISSPFPSVWHTLGDDASILSLPALRRWNRILRIFTCEYLGLTPDFKSTSATKSRSSPEEDEGTDEVRRTTKTPLRRKGEVREVVEDEFEEGEIQVESGRFQGDLEVLGVADEM